MNPQLANFFGQAHCDYLQVFAEAGIPAGLAANGAFAMLLIGLGRGSTRVPAPVRQEATVLLAMLLAGSVAALFWSPLEEPVLAVPLLLAAGRAWSILGGIVPGDAA